MEELNNGLIPFLFFFSTHYIPTDYWGNSEKIFLVQESKIKGITGLLETLHDFLICFLAAAAASCIVRIFIAVLYNLLQIVNFDVPLFFLFFYSVL